MSDKSESQIWTFEAGSHYEAMTIYYRHMGWSEYTTDQEWDFQPYPVEKPIMKAFGCTIQRVKQNEER